LDIDEQKDSYARITKKISEFYDQKINIIAGRAVSINVASVMGSLWKTSYTTFTTLPRDATTAIYEKN
jgi:hypothetical protein